MGPRITDNRSDTPHYLVQVMKQRLRITLVQRRQAQCRAARKPAAGLEGYREDDYRSRLADIYSQHKELFKRLANA